MTDWHRLIDRLDPPADGETPIRHRTGVVVAVNTDGTVDVEVSGVVVPSVAALAGAVITAGDTVQMVAWRGDLLALGATRQNIQGAVQSYTPTFTATTTNPSLGNGSIVGYWQQVGGVVTAWVWLQFGTTGVSQGSGTYIISLPVNADTALHIASASAGRGSNVGSGNCRDDNSVGQSQPLVAMLAAAGSVRMMAPNASFIGSAAPFGWQANDNITLSMTYMVAP